MLAFDVKAKAAYDDHLLFEVGLSEAFLQAYGRFSERSFGI